MSYYETHRAIVRYLPDGSELPIKPGERLAPNHPWRALPGPLLELLPALPASYERLVVGGRVLLVDLRTLVVRDVLPDVVIAGD